MWCAKEAASKALGTGLQGRPKDFVALDAIAEGQLMIEHVPSGRRFAVFTGQVGEFIVAYTSMAEQVERPVTPTLQVHGEALSHEASAYDDAAIGVSLAE